MKNFVELIPIYRDKPPKALPPCGAKRDRTANLQNANLALSQLSYSPNLLERELRVLNSSLESINSF